MVLVGEICRYEQGEMDEKEIIDFIQKLINTGEVWELQGSYQRAAFDMINAGYCHLPEGRNE